MVKIIRIIPSDDMIHKWIAVFDNGKHTKFGAYGMSDYTQHKDKLRKNAYRKRHQKDLETGDPTRAGYLSYYILWNKPTINSSVKDYNRMFFNF
jgi:hypothetical protein